MNLEHIFYQYNPWWEAAFSLESIIKREKVLSTLYPLLEKPDIVMLTGLRRVGKTITMKCLIEYLISHKKVPSSHCLYIRMDDYQLSPLSLLDVIDAYRQTMRISVREQCYVFFDEITYIPDFQRQLKNIYDRGNVKCIVSSSSSSVLKDDSAYLTGRKRIVEINPLDFDEYLQFKNIKISKADNHLCEAYFLDYMKMGGMPEYVLRGEREYLVDLVDDIIMKDIVAYHGIRQANIVREFFILLMERAGKQVSINKMANILKISADTAKRYLLMFESVYLIQLVSRAGKTNETLLSTKKIYVTDVGMRNVSVGFRDKGAIFENLVFLKIKDRDPKYVFSGGHEIDFLCGDMLIEAKFNRELDGAQKTVFDDYPAREKLVINGYSDYQKL